MDLRHVAQIAWKRRWIVLWMVVIAVAAAAVFASSRPARYESTATIALTPDPKTGQGLVSSDNLSALLGTYAQTAKSTLILQRAERILGRTSIPAEIDTSTQAGTGILRISATSEDPNQAAEAARAVAQAFQESIEDNQVLVATLVDPPSPSTTPVQPRPPLIMGVAAVLGLFAGLAAALLLEQFRRRIETPADVAELTHAPVIGRLPRVRTLTRGNARLIWDLPNEIGLQESYRGLRTNLQFLTGSGGQVLQITSPEQGQGKSTVVANLGIATAQIGVETIIVDADLRRPRQHEIFGLPNRTGLSTMLALGSTDPELVASGYENLSILPSGPVPPDPTEMLHVRLPGVIAALREQGALVLIDTPPLLPVSDARLVAPQVNGVVLVIAAGSQRPAAMHAALERLQLVNGIILGIVLNKSGQESDSPGGYYYHAPSDRQVETAQ
jgi:succinoglycan biosynthesis transport protein ExoP